MRRFYKFLYIPPKKTAKYVGLPFFSIMIILGIAFEVIVRTESHRCRKSGQGPACDLKVRPGLRPRSGADPGFLNGGGGLIIKKLYSKSVHGALIKHHFGSSRNDASLCAHKLIQV